MPGCTEVWLTNVPSVSPTTPQPAHTHMKRLVSYLPPFSLPVLHMILSEKQTSSVDKGYKLICGIIAHFLQQQHNQSILNFFLKGALYLGGFCPDLGQLCSGYNRLQG